MYAVPADFQHRIDAFNESLDTGHRVAVFWNPATRRWSVWSVPDLSNNSHPLYRPKILAKLLRPLPNGAGRGVFLFDHARRDQHGNDIGFLPLDERLFDVLRLADSFRSRRHFEETFERPEERRALAESARLRQVVHGSRAYWQGLDRLVVSMNPATPSGGDWRWRYR